MVQADNFLTKFPNNPLTNIRPKMTLEVPKKGTRLITFAYPRNKLLDFTNKSEPKSTPTVLKESSFVSKTHPSTTNTE